MNEQSFIRLAEIVQMNKIEGKIDDRWRAGGKAKILFEAGWGSDDPATGICTHDGKR